MAAHRTLAEPLHLWRIGDPAGEHPVWNAMGAMLYPGRWNAEGDAVIYAAATYSLAMLEKLAHWSGKLPANQHFVEAVVPVGVSYEVFQPSSHPGWDTEASDTSKKFGATWLKEGRSAILMVPSVLSPAERNFVVNTRHPDAAQIRPGLETPVHWDQRLFKL